MVERCDAMRGSNEVIRGAALKESAPGRTATRAATAHDPLIVATKIVDRDHGGSSNLQKYRWTGFLQIKSGANLIDYY